MDLSISLVKILHWESPKACFLTISLFSDALRVRWDALLPLARYFFCNSREYEFSFLQPFLLLTLFVERDERDFLLWVVSRAPWLLNAPLFTVKADCLQASCLPETYAEALAVDGRFTWPPDRAVSALPRSFLNESTSRGVHCVFVADCDPIYKLFCSVRFNLSRGISKFLLT